LVDNFTLYEARILLKVDDKARVVLRGSLKTKVQVKLQSASRGAITAITKAGGSFEKTVRPKATKKSDDS